jgi:hypothetical protein
VQTQREGALARNDHGWSGALTRIVCGFGGSEKRQHPLLEGSPPPKSL